MNMGSGGLQSFYTPSGVTLFGTSLQIGLMVGGFLYAFWRDLVWDRHGTASPRTTTRPVSIRLLA